MKRSFPYFLNRFTPELQLSFENIGFRHSPVVVETDGTGSSEGILLAAHSYDADWRPLSTYEYNDLRVLHITGYYDWH